MSRREINPLSTVNKNFKEKGNEPVLFTELLEFVGEPVPISAQNLTDKVVSDGLGYWRERYRWIKFEETFDTRIGEFRPVEVPKYRYNGLRQFENDIKTSLVLDNLNGQNINEILANIDRKYFVNASNLISAPHYHPEVVKNAFGDTRSTTGTNVVENNHILTYCCPANSKSCCIFAGYVPDLPQDVFMLGKIAANIEPAGLVEVPFPVKFVILSLTSNPNEKTRALENGRIFGSFLTDKWFQQSCYKATKVDNIISAFTEFLDKTTVHGQGRIAEDFDPNDSMSFWSELFEDEDEGTLNEIPVDSTHEEEFGNGEAFSIIGDESSINVYSNPCKRFGNMVFPPLRDLAEGVMTSAKRYSSDFKDAVSRANLSVTISSIPFIYFVIFGPSITFGTLMQRSVSPAFSVSNSILTSGLSTILFALFAGQPISVVGPSGPGFIMERLVSELSKELGMPYFAFRFWVLVYVIITGFVLTAMNLSELAMHTTRALEELFSAAISGFLIIKALFSILVPVPNNMPAENEILNEQNIAILRKGARASTNAFLAIVMVSFNLVVIKFKTSHLISRKTRFWIGAINVPLGILLTIGIDQIWFASYNIDHLKVPPTSKLNFSEWFNFPDWANLSNYGRSTATQVHGTAFIYGFIIGFMIFIEIGLNSMVVLRGRSIKPSPISLNHLMASIVFPTMALLLGLPLMFGVPIRTIANMASLVKVDPSPVPGSAPSWYLVEQRLSVLIVGILVTCSVFFGDVLQFIPVAPLFGLFLFLGIFGLRGLQLKRVLTALLSKRKYWKEVTILEDIPRTQVYVFTLIWLIELILLLILLVLGEFDDFLTAATAIPFILFAAGVIRRAILPKWAWMAPYLEKLDPLCAVGYKEKKLEKMREKELRKQRPDVAE